MTYCTYDTNCQKPIIIKKLIEENEQLKQKLDYFLTETIAGKEYRPKEELEELQRENEQLQQKWLGSEYERAKLVSQIEKMKNCWNCKHYKVGETTCLKGKPHNSGGCFKDWELAE